VSTIEEQEVDYHLREALSHLETALNQSMAIVQENDALKKKEIGAKWEIFIGQFLGQVRDIGKKTKINLLSLISFPKIR
jgi:hypothetical protein